jgi:hypothetical protein
MRLAGKQKQKKSWHDPVLTRVKLNPEQAVLACCYLAVKTQSSGGSMCLFECGNSVSATNT